MVMICLNYLDSYKKKIMQLLSSTKSQMTNAKRNQTITRIGLLWFLSERGVRATLRATASMVHGQNMPKKVGWHKF